MAPSKTDTWWAWWARDGQVVSTLFGVLCALPLLSDALVVVSTASVALAVTSLLLHLIGRRHNKKIVSERVRALFATQHEFSSVRTALHGLAGTMRIKAPWRITLYEATSAETWKRIARTSNDIGYESGGRLEIPLREGVIGWAQLFSTIDELLELPDPVEDPAGWEHFHSSRHVAPEQSRAFRMKSRCYVGLTFPRGSGPDPHHPIGIVVETEIPRGVDRQTAEATLTRETVQLLYRLASLNQALSMLPSQVAQVISE